MTFSTVVSRTPLGSFSSSPMASVPVQPAATPDVRVRDEDGEDEQDHLDEREDAQASQQAVIRNRPRGQENDLDIEDNEQHRGQIELDRETETADRHGGRL